MSLNTQQVTYAIAFKPQIALHTANVAADFWRLSRIDAGFNKFSLVTESDAAEYGKGSEFAEQLFAVSWDISGSLSKYLSSEMAAWAFLYGLGTTNATYLAGSYTITETDACSGLDLPSFSVLEQGGVGCPGGAFVDRVAIGNVINDFGISFQSGPGRASTKMNINFVGSGANAQPSLTVMPATKLVEHEIRGGSAVVSINGVDYVAGASLMNLDMTFANNVRLDSGFYVGSGTQDGAAIRGRMERGSRVFGLNFSARLQQNSTEYTKLKALTTGPATIVLTNSPAESLSVSYHKVAFKSVDVADDNGIVVVHVSCEPMKDALGVVTVVAKTAMVGIGGLV